MNDYIKMGYAEEHPVIAGALSLLFIGMFILVVIFAVVGVLSLLGAR